MKDISKVLADIMKDKNVDYDFDSLYQAALNDSEVQEFIRTNQNNLQTDAITKSAANIYEFVTQRDIVNNNEASTVSGYKPTLILNDGLIDVSYQPTKATIEAEKIAEQKRKITLIDLPKALKEANLDDFDATPGRADALGKSFEFITKLIDHESTRGLYLSGNFGVGKTFLLAGIANKLAEDNYSVTLLHVPTFIAELASHFSDNSLPQALNQLKNVDVLMFDDIGAETLSQWSRDDVLGVILQARMENQLPTFFSSNLSMTELKDHFIETKSSIDPVKADRLMERIRFLAEEVVVEGPNRRQN